MFIVCDADRNNPKVELFYQQEQFMFRSLDMMMLTTRDDGISFPFSNATTYKWGVTSEIWC